LTRDEVIAATSCPSCGAPIGARCRDGGRVRPRNHIKRTGKAEMLAGWSDAGPSPAVTADKERWRQSREARRKHH
jgi:hypothetical protein